MQRIRKLYFDSVKEFKQTQNLVFCGLMAALAVVLSYVASINVGPYIRIGFSGIPNRIVEFLFGPVIGSFFSGALDILKYLLNPAGQFHPGFTFDAMLGGVIYGFILYKKPIKIWRIAVAELLVKLIVNCGFNTFWISTLYGKSFFLLLPARIIKNIVMLPIDSAILFFALTFMAKIFTTNDFKLYKHK